MRVTLHGEDLYQAARALQKAAGTRLSILRSVRVSCTGNALDLLSTDLDAFAHIRLIDQIEHDENDSAMLVDAEFLLKASTVLRKDTVTLTQKDNALCVNGSPIKGVEERDDDFPMWPSVSKKELLSLTGKEFKHLCSSFGRIAAKETETTRISLTGLAFQWSDSTVNLTVTDGHHLLTKPYTCLDSSKGEIVVSAKKMKKIASVITAKDMVYIGVATDAAKKQYLTISWRDAEVLIATISEEYVDFNRVIPKRDNNSEVIVSSNDLSEALKEASAFDFSDSEEPYLIFELREKGINITVPNNDAFSRMVDAKVIKLEEMGEKIGLATKYLLNYLNFCEADEIKIRFKSPLHPIMIVDLNHEDDHTFVQMPVSLK
jgi:DNA polymerase III sliding clamp (beta) subunit (PCNA family)